VLPGKFLFSTISAPLLPSLLLPGGGPSRHQGARDARARAPPGEGRLFLLVLNGLAGWAPA